VLGSWFCRPKVERTRPLNLRFRCRVRPTVCYGCATSTPTLQRPHPLCNVHTHFATSTPTLVPSHTVAAHNPTYDWSSRDYGNVLIKVNCLCLICRDSNCGRVYLRPSERANQHRSEPPTPLCDTTSLHRTSVVENTSEPPTCVRQLNHLASPH
jgi:hypothetical protein